MTRQIKSANIDADILATHDIFIDAVDGHGRVRHLCASPKRGGVICFFDTLSDFRRWERQVCNIRAIQRGELTTLERALQDLYFELPEMPDWIGKMHCAT